MNNTVLSFEHITVRYLQQTLFADLTFRVEQGQNWALVGKSGSGKSALLEAIAGNFNIMGGNASFPLLEEEVQQHLGADPFLTPRKLIGKVGAKYAFRTLSNTTEFYYQQRFNAHDSEDALTVRHYLATIKSYAEQPFWAYERTIDTLHLAHLQEQQLIKLSNGETKRLLIAGALLKNPLLLLLDNPLAGLDKQTRATFNDILGAITASGITIIMATSPGEIPASITHVAELEAGRMVRTSTREEFETHKAATTELPPLDEEELRALLALTTPPAFDVIARLEDVSISYGGKRVLDQISWEVRQGERWALVGPNGAGKSTLLSLLNGDNPQAYGKKITLFDRKRGSGESIWDIKKKIGFVSPELFQYFPAQNTCQQVIESGFYDTLGLFRKSQAANAAVALRWMRVLALEQYAATPFRKVAASVQRLCLLARAMAKNPPLFIFDEPCQGLDAEQQQHFKHVLDTICQVSNATLIYVSHYAQEIPASVTQVLQLDNGRQVAG
ncbi:ATP-binding cassette domain-containing protein [Hymenobacter sp. GOD-10R]|uniref:ATP-binding cassette domain-containing protein n=1 Tax=Hymenobacter sp. GOD-10R TaxID=3093922 RepID=UPI002D78017E|nr:ATP-binding cassette domain-containing protein [Hymenobacter sp. GOD-10R]WRQ27696.1 ATP-binding cassette domain-containing protein [Hymenobacter sp. GOD-10R]